MFQLFGNILYLGKLSSYIVRISLYFYLSLLEMEVNNLNTKPVFERNVYKACGINGVGREKTWYISLATANGIYIFFNNKFKLADKYE